MINSPKGHGVSSKVRGKEVAAEITGPKMAIPAPPNPSHTQDPGGSCEGGSEADRDTGRRKVRLLAYLLLPEWASSMKFELCLLME